MTPKFRRVNLFGGPGVGKSTMAAGLYSILKQKGIKVELVREYVKSWALENRKIYPFDQMYFFAKQLREEDLALRSVDLVVTDSPIDLVICYAKKYGFPCPSELQHILQKFEDEYPSLNYYIGRRGSYDKTGRFETFEEAKQMDVTILEHVVQNCLTKKLILLKEDGSFVEVFTTIFNDLFGEKNNK